MEAAVLVFEEMEGEETEGEDDGSNECRAVVWKNNMYSAMMKPPNRRDENEDSLSSAEEPCLLVVKLEVVEEVVEGGE